MESARARFADDREAVGGSHGPPPSRPPEPLELAHDASRGLEIFSCMLLTEHKGQNYALCPRCKAQFEGADLSRFFFFDARLFSLWCSLPFPPSPAASEIPLWSFFPKAGASKRFFSSLESKKRAQKETPEHGSEARRYTLGLRIYLRRQRRQFASLTSFLFSLANRTHRLCPFLFPQKSTLKKLSRQGDALVAS